MAKKTIAISQDIDCFEMDGKTYAFKGKKFIYNSEKITVEQAFENAELLESLVKEKSDLIYEVNVETGDTKNEPKQPAE
jgi:hypothetical protein